MGRSHCQYVFLSVQQTYLQKHFCRQRRFQGIERERSHYSGEVISDPDDVTPEWLTAVMERGDSKGAGRVRGVKVILSRELQVSTVHRLAVSYEIETPDDLRPRTLFLKLCKPGADAQPPDMCRAEVDFYRTVAPEMTCRPLVRVFDAAYCPTSGRSHLLMEDLSETHSQQAQQSAPGEEMSRLAIEAMARVHARWWNSPQLGNGIGKVFDNEWLAKFTDDLNESVTEFVSTGSTQLSPKQRAAYRLMLDAAPRIWGRLTDPGALTVTHGDTHWWNFLYPIEAGRDAVRVFDWQLWHIDLGARDVAFLLAHGGFAEPRPELEPALLDVYHEALIANGVTGYSREMLQEDYRWSAIRNLNLPVIFRRQGKHPTTWKTALQRSFAAYERLGCADLS
jgi:hypothetical protein